LSKPDQPLLAIETSSEACSVALSLGSRMLERHQHAPLRHAELLLPAVQSLLAEAGMRLSDLGAIVFGRGPGSFTSLRIGIGVVQGLAWGAELPVVPVSSLEAAAQAALQAIRSRPGAGAQTATRPDAILVALDARMGEVFHCSYAVGENGELRALGPEQVSAPAEVNAPEAATLGAGNGFARYPELGRLGESLQHLEEEILPTAAASIVLARQWLQTHKALPAAGAQPVYVRDHVADKPAEGG